MHEHLGLIPFLSQHHLPHCMGYRGPAITLTKSVSAHFAHTHPPCCQFDVQVGALCEAMRAAGLDPEITTSPIDDEFGEHQEWGVKWGIGQPLRPHLRGLNVGLTILSPAASFFLLTSACSHRHCSHEVRGHHDAA